MKPEVNKNILLYSETDVTIYAQLVAGSEAKPPLVI